ncbi:MAG: hypothetical protein V2A61_03435 [Calditrichota bacterium]
MCFKLRPSAVKSISVSTLATLGLVFLSCDRKPNPVDSNPFAPRNIKIAIDGDSAATRDTCLRVSISGENVAFMQLGLDSLLLLPEWEDFDTLKVFNIPRLDGEYWVYGRFASSVGETTGKVRDGIRLDLTARINSLHISAGSDTLEPGSVIEFEMETGETGIAEVSLGSYITGYPLRSIREGLFRRELTIPHGIQENSVQVFGRFNDFLGNQAEPFHADRVFVILGPQLGPILVGRLTIPQASGSDIWYHQGYCFMSDLNRQVHVVDVRNPAQPTLHHVILTADWSQGLSGNGEILALADCRSGIKVISLNPPIFSDVIGHSPLPGLAKDLVIRDTWAYVAAHNEGLLIVDLSNPDRPHLASSLATFCFGESVCLNDTIAYVTGGGGLAVINVKDPFKPVLLAEFEIYDQPRATVFYEDKLYIATRLGRVAVVNVNNPWAPEFHPSFNQLDSVFALTAYPPFLIASRANTISFANITDPLNLPVFANLNHLHSPQGMFVRDRWLFIAGEEELTIVDLFPEE